MQPELNSKEAKLLGLLREFRRRMGTFRNALVAHGAETLLRALDNGSNEKAKSAFAELSGEGKKTLNGGIDHVEIASAKIRLMLETGGSVLPSSENLDYYRKNSGILDSLFLLSVDAFDDSYRPSKISVSGSSPPSPREPQSAADLIDMTLECCDGGIESLWWSAEAAGAWEDAKRILGARYFRPDDWLENMSEPEYESFIIPESDIPRLPPGIRDRMDEIHKSFFFGNWIAVVALSRCLMEYAVADCFGDAPEYKEKAGTDRSPPMREMIRIASKCASEDDMNGVRDFGDRVMHPKKGAGSAISKEDAAKCFRLIRKVIRALYKKRA